MIPIRDDNPTTRRPYVTVALVVVCVLVFIWQSSLGHVAAQIAVYKFGFVPAALFGFGSPLPPEASIPAWTTLFTSMFVHGSFMHLAGNMLYLWIFGNNIEDVTGHGRYLAFYLICGLAAAMAQALPAMNSTIPMIGASGAISGILGAYLLLFPKAKVQVVIPLGILIIRTLPAAWLLGIWIAFQVVSGIAAGIAAGGVAWWAHVGGFVAGMALIHPFRIRTARPSAISRVAGSRDQRSSSRPGRSRIPDSRPARAEPSSPPTVWRRRDR